MRKIVWLPTVALMVTLLFTSTANAQFKFSGFAVQKTIAQQQRPFPVNAKPICIAEADGKAACISEEGMVDMMVSSEMPWSRDELRRLFQQARVANGVQTYEALLITQERLFAAVTLGQKLTRPPATGIMDSANLFTIVSQTQPAYRPNLFTLNAGGVEVEVGTEILYGPNWGNAGTFACNGFGDPGSCGTCCTAMSSVLFSGVAAFAKWCHATATINVFHHLGCIAAEATAIALIYWQWDECSDNCEVPYENEYNAAFEWEDSVAEAPLMANMGPSLDGIIQTDAAGNVTFYHCDYGLIPLTGRVARELAYIASEEYAEITIFTNTISNIEIRPHDYILRRVGQLVFDKNEPVHTQVLKGTLSKTQDGDFILTDHNNKSVALDILPGTADIFESKLGATLAALGGMNLISLDGPSRFGLLRFNIVRQFHYCPKYRYNIFTQRLEETDCRTGEWINDHDI